MRRLQLYHVSGIHRAKPADAEWLHRTFNDQMRLNASLFIDLDQARHVIRAWMANYNTARRHSSIGYKTPTAYAGTLTASKGATLAEALTAAG